MPGACRDLTIIASTFSSAILLLYRVHSDGLLTARCNTLIFKVLTYLGFRGSRPLSYIFLLIFAVIYFRSLQTIFSEFAPLFLSVFSLSFSHSLSLYNLNKPLHWKLLPETYRASSCYSFHSAGLISFSSVFVEDNCRAASESRRSKFNPEEPVMRVSTQPRRVGLAA